MPTASAALSCWPRCFTRRRCRCRRHAHARAAGGRTCSTASPSAPGRATSSGSRRWACSATSTASWIRKRIAYPPELTRAPGGARNRQPPAGDVLGEFVELRKRGARRGRGRQAAAPRGAGARSRRETAEARLLRAVDSPRQLEEVMVDFWFNHFNVFAGKGIDRALIASYERDAIRPYALGTFRDLLGATAKHPAMLFYLDNWSSTANGYAPRGKRAARRPRQRPERKLRARADGAAHARRRRRLHARRT